MSLSYRLVIWAIVLAALVVRIAHHLSGRSLWMDEAFIALNIIDKPFGALFGTLSFNQAAPLGFLLVERLTTMLFGKGELELRMFPFLCGVASVFLFLWVSRRLLSTAAVPIALALFAFSDSPIYYTSEVKQYSVDVAAVLILLLAADSLFREPLTPRRKLGWAIAGSLVVWFSHAAILVALGVAAALVVASLGSRHSKRLVDVGPVLAAWAVSLLGASAHTAHVTSSLLGSFRQTAHVTSSLLGSFRQDVDRGDFDSGEIDGVDIDPGGAPVFPTGISWLRNPAGDLAAQLGIPTDGIFHNIAYVFALAAFIGLLRMAFRRPRVALLLACPPLAAFAAAALELYPFRDRMILFLVPILVLFIAEGVATAAALDRTRARWVWPAVALAVCAVPATAAAVRVYDPREREEIAHALSTLRSEWRPGDSLYLHYRSQYAFRYYLECECGPGDLPVGSKLRRPPVEAREQYPPALVPSDSSVVVGEYGQTVEDFIEQVAWARGEPRVWVLATRQSPSERVLHAYLGCVGRRVDERRATGATLFLYDLRSWRSDSSRERACATEVRR